MTRRTTRGAVSANPALVGAVTVLVVIVATFLAYNANSGLPFVPTYHLDVVVPNADGLGPGADVRVGGGRVGRVRAVVPVTRPGAAAAAKLELVIDHDLGPVATDTTADIRAVSALGARYVQLELGHARTRLPGGRPLVVHRDAGAVDLDEVLGTFDAPTRRALRGVTTNLGDGLAGRGADVNEALARAPRLLTLADRVLGRLADPVDGVAPFLRGAESAAVAVAPQAVRLGALIDDTAQTAGAIAEAGPALDRLLRDAPADTAAITRDLTPVRATLRQARGLLRDARPAATHLPQAAPRIAALLRDATPLLRRTPAFADRLGAVAGPLLGAARDAPTLSALRALAASLGSLEPTLRFVVPMQTRCNYLGLWARNVPDVIGEGDRTGTWFRYLLMVKPDEMLQSATPATNLHVDPYPVTGQGDGECEAGNERYVDPTRRVIGNTPAREPGATETTSPAPDGARR